MAERGQASTGVRPLGERVITAALEATESGWVPDAVVRAGIRAICRRRIAQQPADPEVAARETDAFVRRMSAGPIAVVPALANDQHYEVPAGFFELVLGPRLKYSSCYFADAKSTLAQAEDDSLERTVVNAQLQDGQRILELGCGWGSLTLYMAQRFPAARITAVSNSSSQRRFIEQRAAAAGLGNVDVITCDVNELSLDGPYDRVVSVEMFEHVRNHAALLARLCSLMVPGGKLLVHVFCTGGTPYAFEDEGADDWMARNFFSGGVMPSDDLLLRYQQHLRVERQWRWSGGHYGRTAEAWLANLDRHRSAAIQVLDDCGATHAERAVQRWRMFFMACAELFAYDGGKRWWVSHYRFAKSPS